MAAVAYVARVRYKNSQRVEYDEGGMTVANYQKPMKMERFSHGNNLTKLNVHLDNVKKRSNKMSCEVCGESTY